MDFKIVLVLMIDCVCLIFFQQFCCQLLIFVCMRLIDSACIFFAVPHLTEKNYITLICIVYSIEWLLMKCIVFCNFQMG